MRSIGIKIGLPTDGEEANQPPALGPRGLMLAVLKDALHCWALRQDRRVHHRKLAIEAERWIRDDDPSSLFSFSNVCGALDLDPATVRRRALSIQPRPEGVRASDLTLAIAAPSDA
jgi:hypothetical protein